MRAWSCQEGHEACYERKGSSGGSYGSHAQDRSKDFLAPRRAGSGTCWLPGGQGLGLPAPGQLGVKPREERSILVWISCNGPLVYLYQAKGDYHTRRLPRVPSESLPPKLICKLKKSNFWKIWWAISQYLIHFDIYKPLKTSIKIVNISHHS